MPILKEKKNQQFKNPILFTRTIPLYQNSITRPGQYLPVESIKLAHYTTLGVNLRQVLVVLFKACGAERHEIYKGLVKVTFNYQTAEYDWPRLKQVLMKNWLYEKQSRESSD